MRSLALPSTTGGPEGPGEIPLTQPHCCHPLSPQPSSLLELFIQQGGLQSLAECVPSLYPFLWPEKLANRTVSKPTPPPGCKPHFLLHIPSSLPFHSTVMLSLGLRLGCYGNIMRENLPVSFVLLRLMLGVELKGTPFPFHHACLPFLYISIPIPSCMSFIPVHFHSHSIMPVFHSCTFPFPVHHTGCVSLHLPIPYASSHSQTRFPGQHWTSCPSCPT